MTTPTTKPPELSKAQQIENIMLAMAMPFIAAAAIQWTATTWIRQYRHAKRHKRAWRPQMPHQITTFNTGGVLAADTVLLRQWGISVANWSEFWSVEGGVVGMVRNILVADAQWEMADAILHQNGYFIMSAPGSKRGATFTTPWGVGARARSFDEGINAAIGSVLGAGHHGVKDGRKKAKLGKTYK